MTNGDANAVSSNAVFDALALKAPLISPYFTNDITVKPPGFVGQTLTLAPNPSTGFLHYATPQGGHIRFKATYADVTATNEYTFPDATGTIALTSEVHNDYEITSAQGRRLIASLAAIRGASNAGTCYLATTRATSVTFTVKTSTGYARLVNPDNTLGTQAGTGVAANSITLTIPASGLHRAYGIISVTNGGTTRSGNITYLYLYDARLTEFSGVGLSSLTSLYLSSNQLTTFSGVGLSSLTSLDLNTNQLTTFSGTGLSSLTSLDLNTNQLTTFSGTGLSALLTLYLYNNQLTAFSSAGLSSLTNLNLDYNKLTEFSGTGLSALTLLTIYANQLTTFSGAGLSALTNLYLNGNQLTTFSGTGLSSLTGLYLYDNQLTEFSATGMSALTTLYIQNNNLTSILATGLNLSYNVYGMYGSDIGDNDLSLEALQAFVDSLAVTTTGIIEYAGNPGATAFAAWLTPANDKDYIWSNT